MRLRHLASILSVLTVAGACQLAGCSSDANSLNQPVPSSKACKADTDCGGATAVCDVLAEQCVPCLFDTQCDPGARCRAKTCVVPTTCESSLDCVGAANATICDPAAKECVQCVETVDCGDQAECTNNVCVPYDACQTSLECGAGKVCDTSAGRCVECVVAADCDDGNVCVGNTCEVRTECVSDNQCTPQGKLCDKSLGYCVDCLTNDQCPDSYHCEAGACALNACQAGASKCQGNSVVSCDASGQSWGTPFACPDKTTCVAQGGVASCESSTCDAGLTYCVGDKLITCSDDGTSITSTVDCAAQQKHCSQGVCSAQACAPNTVYCEGKDVRQCNAAGTDSFVLQSCGAQQSCDPSSATCVSQLCTPGAPACNGALATTCNSAGSGYTAGGTDCAAQGKTCDAGVCVAGCTPGGGPPTNVRLGEVFMGSVDYIIITNLGSCAAQLDTLSVHIASNKPLTMDFDFPVYTLDPGASAYLIYGTTALAGDFPNVDIANFLLPSLGEYVALCNGPCSGGVILDYFAHADGGQPPAAPAGVTFTPGPLTGIDDFNSATMAYKRVAYTGAYPSFKAGDWQVGTATRP